VNGTRLPDERNGIGDQPLAEPDWAAIRRRVDAQHAVDIEMLQRRPSLETLCPECNKQLLDHDHTEECSRRVRRRPDREHPQPTRLRAPRPGDHERRRRYIEAAVAREADACRSAPEGLWQETLSRAAWALARFECEGELSAGDIFGALVPAALASGLPRREVTSTIRSALRRRCGRAAA
jgi:hypothetical protein